MLTSFFKAGDNPLALKFRVFSSSWRMREHQFRTLKVTTLSEKYPGDRVNIEVDMIARYLERLVQFEDDKNKLTKNRIRAMMSDQ